MNDERRFLLRMDESLHRRIFMESVMRGVSMSEVIRGVLDQELPRHEHHVVEQIVKEEGQELSEFQLKMKVEAYLRALQKPTGRKV